MENNQILETWQAYNVQLENLVNINRKVVADITQLKIKSLIGSMKTTKVTAILIGFIWVFAGVFLLTNLCMYSFSQISIYFLVSAFLQILITAIAIGIYLYQSILIHRIQNSENVVDTQYQLNQLKISSIWVFKILILQLPLWTTFYLSDHFFAHSTPLIYLIQIAVTLLFTVAAILLFINIQPKNFHKKWFKLIFNGIEWTPILHSIELCKEIEAFKKEGVEI